MSMDTLTGIKVFLQVVESGSFVGAADRLDVSAAMVSKHVMNAEQRLGVRLLNRGSRTLSLTEPGRIYFERCKVILDDLEEAELELGSLGSAARGTLRVTCPSWFARQRLASLLAQYRTRFPEIVVDVSFEDRFVDLVEDGYDLALRVTSRLESLPAGLIARPVRSIPFLVGASHEYIKRNGAPKSLQDLAKHDCIAVGNLDSWVFQGPEGRTEVPARIVQRFRSMAGVPHAVAAGTGLAPLPLTLFEEPVFKDILVPVLTDFPLSQATLYVVYISRRYVPLKIRSFIDFVLEFVAAWEGQRRASALPDPVR
jgi:DNA-binding transcriptional LysR family regulator